MKRELIEIAILVISQIVSIAFNRGRDRADLRAFRKRLSDAEQQLKVMHKEYVPRPELELHLRAIEHTAKQTNSMVQAIVFGGGARDVALEALKASGADTITTISETIHALGETIHASGEPLEYTKITISGLDGKGGLNRWEGRTAYMYLDNRSVNGKPAPLVTVGIGCAISLDEALTLPFQLDGRPALKVEIQNDYLHLQHSNFGFAAAHYAAYTSCRLPDAAIDELVRTRFASFLCALRTIFPGFENFPETAKAGCMDLIYGLGPAGLAAPHYPSFRRAGNQGDFVTMAAECASDANLAPYAARNEARKQLFLAAAREARQL